MSTPWFRDIKGHGRSDVLKCVHPAGERLFITRDARREKLTAHNVASRFQAFRGEE